MNKSGIVWGLLLASLIAAADVPPPVIRSDISASQVMPGQHFALTMTVLVPTWMTEPAAFPDVDLANTMVRRPPEAQYSTSERIGGETWAGVVREYEISPLASGRLSIPAYSIAVTYAHPDTREPVSTTSQSESFVVDVARPPGTERLVPFIAATSLVLEQRIEGDNSALEPGDAFKRHVTAAIEGSTPYVLPDLIEPLGVTGLSEYPAEPVVSSVDSATGVTGERHESVTYVAATAGRAHAPSISITWYNLETRAVETVQVPGFDIAARGAGFSRATDRSVVTIGIAAATALLVIVVIRRRIAEPVAEWRARRSANYEASELHAYRMLRAAIKKQHLGDVITAMSRWDACVPPTSGSGEDGLAATLGAFKAAHYGGRQAPAADWTTLAVWSKAARRERHKASSGLPASAGDLPPLNPD